MAHARLHPPACNFILGVGRATSVAQVDGWKIMLRVIAIVGAGLALAACSSNASWLNLDSLKPKPLMETVQFESTPPGAEVKLSNGQTCRTPCALAVPQPEKTGLSASFALNGYQPATEQIDLVSQGDGTSKLRPNPVTAQLAAVPPPKKKKVVRKKKQKQHVVAKPAAKPQPAPKPAAAPPTAAAQPQAPSPWPPAQTQPAK